ncbi:helix-turn-helix domain-containing protein [Asanoa sp. NPDC049573]|uniref:helix-turn-helix domain-containing protein n=1 Tax=Asanoa sp. NPDC049573 TaxID=3155396 RepID=UPI00343D167A
MADVARTVGPSHQTVSRALNDHPLVRPDTRARVLKAIEDPAALAGELPCGARAGFGQRRPARRRPSDHPAPTQPGVSMVWYVACPGDRVEGKERVLG